MRLIPSMSDSPCPARERSRLLQGRKSSAAYFCHDATGKTYIPFPAFHLSERFFDMHRVGLRCASRIWPKATSLRPRIVERAAVTRTTPLPKHIQQRAQIRLHATDSSSEQSRRLTDREDDATEAAKRKAQVEEHKKQQPSYDLTFTCKKCMDRSTHRISKQGYHYGTIVITCPGCNNKHLISDHLRIFSDKDTTLEDIMKEKGELLKKGVLGADGDVEFYPEATEDAVYIKKIPFVPDEERLKRGPKT